MRRRWMWGASAGVTLLRDGQAQFAAGENVTGCPFFVPSVAVSSIGAGGGSIASVDAFGMLKVGPDSAARRRGRRVIPRVDGPRGSSRFARSEPWSECGHVSGL